MNQPDALREENHPVVAYYYPNPMWVDGDWIKSLVLFFDGVSLLLPDYLKDKPFNRDPAIATGLAEAELLRILEPETYVDQQAAEELATVLTDLISQGVLDDLRASGQPFHTLSLSRLGASADPQLANMLHEELERRGLVTASEDGVSVPMHPEVRVLILVVLAQILRARGPELGVEFAPTTDRPQVNQAVAQLLGAPDMPSAGNVVSLDLEAVGLDVSRVPIDELLSFRAQHGAEFRRYARELRTCVRILGALPEAERANSLRDRQEHLRDLGADLRQAGMTLGQKASLGLGIAGATWTAVTGDLVGGILAGGAGAAGIAAGGQSAGPYSYLYRAVGRFE